MSEVFPIKRIRAISVVASVALIGVQAAQASSANDAGGFRDDFEQLDQSRWFISSGWANGAHQNCLWHENRIEVADGILRISLTDDPKGDRAYSCGEIQSKDRFGYGAYEARMKVPYLSGINANFFTHIGSPQKRPHNEIDFEFIWKGQPTLQTNYYSEDVGGREALHDVSGEDEFHDFAFIWEPDRLRWFINGEMIREETGEDVPDLMQKIYLSVWSTDTLTDWMGRFRYPGEPLVLEVDWTSYTPLGNMCQFDDSIICSAEWTPATQTRAAAP